ncbi:MAG: hypothetical protein KatS3mg076_0025 [Candidatus Binatia bacterium]|nr:MAG: hypothetical protein KatS3mg076_0025 [Candidatus Binatia bacterium]
MAELSPREAVARAVRRLFRPIVRQLIHHGLTFPEASQILRRVFVEVAEEVGKLPGRKLSDSRIALITGIPRKEVAQLRDRPEEELPLPLEKHFATRLLGRWTSDPRFLTPDGQPRVLPFESETSEPSFSELVRTVGGDIPPRAVLDELVRVGAAEVSPTREVTLLTRRYVPSAGTLEKIDMLGEDGAEFLSTINHNIFSPPDEAFFQQKIVYDNIGSRGVPTLRRELRRMADAFLARVDRLMASYDRDRNPEAPGGERYRVVLGAHYFQEPFPAEPEEEESGGGKEREGAARRRGARSRSKSPGGRKPGETREDTDARGPTRAPRSRGGRRSEEKADDGRRNRAGGKRAGKNRWGRGNVEARSGKKSRGRRGPGAEDRAGVDRGRADRSGSKQGGAGRGKTTPGRIRGHGKHGRANRSHEKCRTRKRGTGKCRTGNQEGPGAAEEEKMTRWRHVLGSLALACLAAVGFGCADGGGRGTGIVGATITGNLAPTTATAEPPGEEPVCPVLGSSAMVSVRGANVAAPIEPDCSFTLPDVPPGEEVVLDIEAGERTASVTIHNVPPATVVVLRDIRIRDEEPEVTAIRVEPRTIDEALGLSIVADPPKGLAPLAVRFALRATVNAIEGVTWFFGDRSEPSHELRPVHVYERPGEYVVEVVARVGEREARAFTVVRVRRATIADRELRVELVGEPQAGPPPLDVLFTARVENAEGEPLFFWEFGDGETLETHEATVHHRYSVVHGEFVAVVTVRDATGREAGDSFPVVVKPREVDLAPRPAPTPTGGRTEKFTPKGTATPGPTVTPSANLPPSTRTANLPPSTVTPAASASPSANLPPGTPTPLPPAITVVPGTRTVKPTPSANATVGKTPLPHETEPPGDLRTPSPPDTDDTRTEPPSTGVQTPTPPPTNDVTPTEPADLRTPTLRPTGKEATPTEPASNDLRTASPAPTPGDATPTDPPSSDLRTPTRRRTPDDVAPTETEEKPTPTSKAEETRHARTPPDNVPPTPTPHPTLAPTPAETPEERPPELETPRLPPDEEPTPRPTASLWSPRREPPGADSGTREAPRKPDANAKT